MRVLLLLLLCAGAEREGYTTHDLAHDERKPESSQSTRENGRIQLHHAVHEG